MRSLAPWLLFLALLAGAAWLLFGAEPDTGTFDPAGRPAEHAAPPVPSTGPIALAPPPGTRSPEPATRGPRTPAVIDPRTLPRGPLEVVVLGPDDVPIRHEDVTVAVEPGKGAKAWFATPLLRPDPDTNVWKADDVFAGPVRVRVFGDTIVAREVETQVSVEPQEPLRVHVDRAGSIEYAVTTFGAEPLPEVTLQLLDEARRPALVAWQVRSQTMLTQPRWLREATLPPEGVIFGIPPGRYTLRATSQAGEYEESQVEVAALQVLKANLRVRR